MLVLFFPDWLEKIAVWPIYMMKRCAKKFACTSALSIPLANSNLLHNDSARMLSVVILAFLLFSILGKHE
jgi:hypothetical protein